MLVELKENQEAIKLSRLSDVALDYEPIDDWKN